MRRNIYLQGLFIKFTKKITCNVGLLLKITNKICNKIRAAADIPSIGNEGWTSDKIKKSARYSTNYMKLHNIQPCAA